MLVANTHRNRNTAHPHADAPAGPTAGPCAGGALRADALKTARHASSGNCFTTVAIEFFELYLQHVTAAILTNPKQVRRSYAGSVRRSYAGPPETIAPRRLPNPAEGTPTPPNASSASRSHSNPSPGLSDRMISPFSMTGTSWNSAALHGHVLHCQPVRDRHHRVGKDLRRQVADHR